MFKVTLMLILRFIIRPVIYLLPESLSKLILIKFCKLLMWIEKYWFLHYVKYHFKSGNNYFETVRKIKSNILCPKTIITIYDFWINNPDHEAFKGLSKEKI